MEQALLIHILAIIILLMNLKWILIALLFPFQVCSNKRLKIEDKTNKRNYLLLLLSLPYLVWEKIMHWGWERYMLFQVGTIPSMHFRRWIYRSLGADIKHDAVFHFKTEIRDLGRLSVGEGTIIGDNAILDARGGLSIGENVNLSSNVSIYTVQHDHRNPYFHTTKFNEKVVIDKYVWLGPNVIVLPGVHIGEGAVCCAGCIVTKDVEPYTVVAGIPAKKVNERPKDLRYNFKARTCCRLY